MPGYNVQSDDCVVLTSNDPFGHKWLCFRNPLWKGFCIGLAVGFLITFIIFVVVGVLVWNSCNSTDSKGALSITANITVTPYNGKTTPAYPRTTYPPLTTVSTTPYRRRTTPSSSDHTCNILGRCTSPPQLAEGMECVMESTGGLTFVKFSALSRNAVDSFDHCPVSYCLGLEKWSPFNVSTSVTECYTTGNSGAVYSGKNTCTETGRMCQRWDSDSPHRRNMDHIPTNSRDLHSNYCRDPGPPYENKPWCYTTDPKKRWEFCHVDSC